MQVCQIAAEARRNFNYDSELAAPHALLLNARAIFAARVLLPARLFNTRTSFAVHARLFILLALNSETFVLLACNKI